MLKDEAWLEIPALCVTPGIILLENWVVELQQEGERKCPAESSGRIAVGARWRSGNSVDSHSEGPRFDSRSGHPDFGFQLFSEITPGECWDEPLTKATADSFPILPEFLSPVQLAPSLMTSLSTRIPCPARVSVGDAPELYRLLVFYAVRTWKHEQLEHCRRIQPRSRVRVLMNGNTYRGGKGDRVARRNNTLSTIPTRGSGGAVAMALASHHGGTGSITGGFTPGSSHEGIVLDDAACRWVFSGYCRLLRPSITAPLHPRISFHVMSGDEGQLWVPAGKSITQRIGSLIACTRLWERVLVSDWLLRAPKGPLLSKPAGCQGATVAERLACSPSHQGDPGSIPGRVTADFRIWESCQTMPLVFGLSRGSPLSPALSFRHCSILYKSPSSAPKTSMLKAVQISSLTHSIKTLKDLLFLHRCQLYWGAWQGDRGVRINSLIASTRRALCSLAVDNAPQRYFQANERVYYPARVVYLHPRTWKIVRRGSEGQIEGFGLGEEGARPYSFLFHSSTSFCGAASQRLVPVACSFVELSAGPGPEHKALGLRCLITFSNIEPGHERDCSNHLVKRVAETPSTDQ
ncbi:hypothetical protein PR048_032207 [Dryococelus australis]|uniref:Uncharacterized protein n=1 Tax=Dryococelus australis TaxID=614101 RepID=A0ABQ9G1J4_9NEOP|nr:hypothetical protein PR048_032207 [Dryococelus australis]